MKKNKLWQLGIAIIIAVFFLSSCKKTTTDVVATNADNFQLLEKDAPPVAE